MLGARSEKRIPNGERLTENGNTAQERRYLMWTTDTKMATAGVRVLPNGVLPGYASSEFIADDE